MTGIENIPVLPKAYSLGQNYPNPFNPITTIDYQLSSAGQVKLTVFNTRGQNVRTLLDRRQSAGAYSLTFDASNLASGVYFYRINIAGEFSQINKMILLK